MLIPTVVVGPSKSGLSFFTWWVVKHVWTPLWTPFKGGPHINHGPERHSVFTTHSVLPVAIGNQRHSSLEVSRDNWPWFTYYSDDWRHCAFLQTRKEPFVSSTEPPKGKELALLILSSFRFPVNLQAQNGESISGLSGIAHFLRPVTKTSSCEFDGPHRRRHLHTDLAGREPRFGEIKPDPPRRQGTDR